MSSIKGGEGRTRAKFFWVGPKDPKTTALSKLFGACFQVADFLTSYRNFHHQAQNVLTLTRDTLASNQSRLVDNDDVCEHCTLCITGHNNGASYSKAV